MGAASNTTKMTPGDTRRFTAFISYSHADAEAASKLQRRLERYRLPKRVAQARANSSQALGPIFRDREDLAVASSLSDAIRDAIARAEALIVLCSPDAVSSPWVAAEIDLFRAHHPDKPIFAVLLSGNPATSFPAILTANGNEPLAADLRPNGDGPQLGFLKIVAGIAGVSLDTLIQRDAQRRIRRVTAITAGALAAMLVMGIMTTYALQARNEAARQRASAEGLVEYMLTDLRGKLRGVGRIEIMDAVNERAMRHYTAQGDLAHLPADSLERRARLLQTMGEDDEKTGNLEQAAAKFREAHRTTAALLLREPQNADRVFAHAQSEYWVGYAAYLIEDWGVANRHWSAYQKLALRLVDADPSNANWLREVGYAEGNLCTLSLETRLDANAALSICASALQRMLGILERRPNDTSAMLDVANRYAWIADAYRAAGERSKEVEMRTTGKALVDKLITFEPDNYDYRDMWVAAQTALAQAELAVGSTANARSRLLTTRKQIAQMVAYDPQNKNWRNYSNNLEKILDKMGDSE
jgi:hypothetical protein